MEKYFVPGNKINEQIVLSPSKEFELIICSYKTKEGCQNYTNGTIIRISDKKIIAEIKRNSCIFNHTFFMKNGEEWLQTGRTYMSQIFVNLITEKIYENLGEKSDGFRWSNLLISADGCTLAVCGCYWDVYVYKFFDFTNPDDLWPELCIETKEPFYGTETGDYDGHWNNDSTFTIYFTNTVYDDEDLVDVEKEQIIYDNDDIYIKEQETIFERIDNKMIIKYIWKSKYFIKTEEEFKKEKAKLEKENELLKKEIEMEKLIKEELLKQNEKFKLIN